MNLAVIGFIVFLLIVRIAFVIGRGFGRHEFLEAMYRLQIINQHNETELARMKKDHLCLNCQVAIVWPNEIKEH